MQCVILAGGLGTRLGAIARHRPKALVPINGRPFVDYQLALLAREGISQVVFCIGNLGDQIVAHVGTGGRFGLRADYIEDGLPLRGTAGALRRALDAGLLADAFFVLYGDSYLPIEYQPIFDRYRRGGLTALMTVMRNEGRWDRSNVMYCASRVTLYQKECDDATRARMTHIDYGLSVLSRALVAKEIEPNVVSDLADLYHRLSLAGELGAYEVAERFYEVGSEAGIAAFSDYASARGL
jgi:NDP-sugar pyrophosphorylase family protein